MDKNIYGLSPQELAEIKSAPGSLEEALDHLKNDHEFMLQGNVFSQDLVESWIDFKIETEVDEIRLRPTPAEFFMYFDV